MTAAAARMLRAMDRAVALWSIPVIGKEKGRILRRLIDKHAPSHGIEVGSLFGYSAILLAGAMPRARGLLCIEENGFLAQIVEDNVRARGSRPRAVVTGDALRALPLLRGPVDLLLLDAKKDDYLDYLRAVEPRLTRGALVVADNTGVFRREVRRTSRTSAARAATTAGSTTWASTAWKCRCTGDSHGVRRAARPRVAQASLRHH